MYPTHSRTHAPTLHMQVYIVWANFKFTNIFTSFIAKLQIVYRVIRHHDFRIKSSDFPFIFGNFFLSTEISEKKSKDNIYHRKFSLSLSLFILLLNFFFSCFKSARQSRHTLPVNTFFFHQVVGKTFSENICMHVVEINFNFKLFDMLQLLFISCSEKIVH